MLESARYLNNGTNSAPALRSDLCLITLANLPEMVAAPRGALPEILRAIDAAGFEGVCDGRAEAMASGLPCMNVIRLPENPLNDLRERAEKAKATGFSASVCVLGNGHESDDEMRGIAEALLSVEARTGHRLLLETHRGTVTQDIYRTLKLVDEFPDLAFCCDFAQWYTGHELGILGGDRIVELIDPVLARSVAIQARVGHSGCIQIDIGDALEPAFLSDHKAVWNRVFTHFLESAGPGDVMSFAPELVPGEIFVGDQRLELNYSQGKFSDSGEWVEHGDRWRQALRLKSIAEACFEACQK